MSTEPPSSLLKNASAMTSQMRPDASNGLAGVGTPESGSEPGRGDLSADRTRFGDLVAQLRDVHAEIGTLTDRLAGARLRRSQLAGLLHEKGHSWRWIGAQIGVTSQALGQAARRRSG